MADFKMVQALWGDNTTLKNSRIVLLPVVDCYFESAQHMVVDIIERLFIYHTARASSQFSHSALLHIENEIFSLTETRTLKLVLALLVLQYESKGARLRCLTLLILDHAPMMRPAVNFIVRYLLPAAGAYSSLVFDFAIPGDRR